MKVIMDEYATACIDQIGRVQTRPIPQEEKNIIAKDIVLGYFRALLIRHREEMKHYYEQYASSLV